ncbi:MAG TPA: hypothetical protein H9730_11390 [Candidatus Mediterraneibacter stercoripullorum]|nr:hypothetical protein [Candidatus Mediterraneibacter stercoripullorum]
MAKNETGTPYDDVFRTLLNDCTDLIIPVINDTFGKNYVMGKDKPILEENEMFLTGKSGDQERTITDSHIMIRGEHFHIECQSVPDGSMVVRMFEYDIQIGMLHAEVDQETYTVEFPNSAVLYLRSVSKTPDRLRITLKVPGSSCAYDVPIIKAKQYSIDEIFRKELYFLIPFHIFCYEASFKQCEEDSTKLAQLAGIFTDIRKRLEVLTEKGVIDEYYQKTILTMSEKVINNIAAKYQKTAERIGDIMGGKILEYEAKTILNQGRKEGREEGRTEKGIVVFCNMIARGFSPKEAQAIAELTDEEVAIAEAQINQK